MGRVEPQRTTIGVGWTSRTHASDYIPGCIIVNGGENCGPIRTGPAIKGAIDNERARVGATVPLDAFGHRAAFQSRRAKSAT